MCSPELAVFREGTDLEDRSPLPDSLDSGPASGVYPYGILEGGDQDTRKAGRVKVWG